MKEKASHKVKIIKRKRNTPQLEDFITGSKVFEPDDGILYGGLFSTPKTSMFLTEIIMDKGVDANEIEFLESPKGQKIQKAKFRDEYLRPIKKILKNRKGSYEPDIQFARQLVVYKMVGLLESLMQYLDNKKSYTTLDIAIWKRLN